MRPKKVIEESVYESKTEPWVVKRGCLKAKGRSSNDHRSIFKVIAEKLPFECLSKIESDMKARGLQRNGIYFAHDSMGAVRYAGRGRIFSRLRRRKRKHRLELEYFSLYVIDKRHEREIETLVIRAASHLLFFNVLKKRTTLDAGSLRDYEPGAHFYSLMRRNRKR